MDFPSETIEDLSYENLAPIQITDLSEDEAARIPTWWKDVLALPEHERITRAITAWNRALPGRFNKFLAHLAQTGTGIYLVRDTDMQLHLLYAAHDIDNQRPTCWAGAMPLADDDPAIRHRLPTELITFHTTVHDGFHQVTGAYNGWLPMREMFALSEYIDVDEAEFYETPPDFNPHEVDFDQVIGVFVDSSYRYAVDMANRDNPAAGWYSFGGSLGPTTNFWEDVDEFMLIATR